MNTKKCEKENEKKEGKNEGDDGCSVSVAEIP